MILFVYYIYRALYLQQQIRAHWTTDRLFCVTSSSSLSSVALLNDLMVTNDNTHSSLYTNHILNDITATEKLCHLIFYGLCKQNVIESGGVTMGTIILFFWRTTFWGSLPFLVMYFCYCDSSPPGSSRTCSEYCLWLLYVRLRLKYKQLSLSITCTCYTCTLELNL